MLNCASPQWQKPPTFDQSLVLLLSAGQGLNLVYIQCVCYAIKVSLVLC